MEKIVIKCEVIITPGGGSRQNHVQLLVSGEPAIDSYEHDLDAGQKKVVSAICAAQSRLLGRYGQTLFGE